MNHVQSILLDGFWPSFRNVSLFAKVTGPDCAPNGPLKCTFTLYEHCVVTQRFRSNKREARAIQVLFCRRPVELFMASIPPCLVRTESLETRRSFKCPKWHFWRSLFERTRPYRSRGDPRFVYVRASSGRTRSWSILFTLVAFARPQTAIWTCHSTCASKMRPSGKRLRRNRTAQYAPAPNTMTAHLHTWISNDCVDTSKNYKMNFTLVHG